MYVAELVLAVVIAYLFGSISSAIIVCKVMGLPDPRSQGSRNPGATNVLRIGGKKPALVTLVGDMLKGLIPVLLAKWIGLSPLFVALVMLAAFVGHLYPIYFRFEGGKGVATVLGGLLGLAWQVGVCCIITWGIVAGLFRYSSLASLVTVIITPGFVFYFTGNWIYVVTTAAMALLVIYRHRSNIRKLLAGNENKIGKKL